MGKITILDSPCIFYPFIYCTPLNQFIDVALEVGWDKTKQNWKCVMMKKLKNWTVWMNKFATYNPDTELTKQDKLMDVHLQSANLALYKFCCPFYTKPVYLCGRCEDHCLESAVNMQTSRELHTCVGAKNNVLPLALLCHVSRSNNTSPPPPPLKRPHK